MRASLSAHLPPVLSTEARCGNFGLRPRVVTLRHQFDDSDGGRRRGCCARRRGRPKQVSRRKKCQTGIREQVRGGATHITFGDQTAQHVGGRKRRGRPIQDQRRIRLPAQSKPAKFVPLMGRSGTLSFSSADGGSSWRGWPAATATVAESRSWKLRMLNQGGLASIRERLCKIKRLRSVNTARRK